MKTKQNAEAIPAQVNRALTDLNVRLNELEQNRTEYITRASQSYIRSGLADLDKKLTGHLAKLESRVDKTNNRLDQVKPIKGEPNGDTIQVDTATRRELAAIAQALGLRDANELAQIVLHAFFDMYENDSGQTITFPLMLQQVLEAT